MRSQDARIDQINPDLQSDDKEPAGGRRYQNISYLFLPGGFCFPFPTDADFCCGAAAFEPEGCPCPLARIASCLGDADDFAGFAGEFAAAAPFFDFSFSGFFFSSIFFGASLIPASLRNTLAWSSGLRAFPRSCAWKKSSRTLSNFGPRSNPMASSSAATPGKAFRIGFHLNR